MAKTRFLVWIDLEMTGVDWNLDHPLEIAVVVTEVEAPCVEVACYESTILPEDPLWKNQMNEFVLNMHTVNGLITDCENNGLPSHVVEHRVIDMLKDIGPANCFMMAGSNNTICDRRFVEMCMPNLNKWMKPEMHDVAVFRRGFVFCGRKDLDCYGQTLRGKKYHRSMPDIRDHLNEWRQYAVMIESFDRPPWED